LRRKDETGSEIYGRVTIAIATFITIKVYISGQKNSKGCEGLLQAMNIPHSRGLQRRVC
jgi:hypothetical protein